MRTSLNETRQIEEFLLGSNHMEEQLLFEAQMTLDPALKEKVSLQRNAYAKVKAYGRKQLRTELDGIETKLFNQPKYAGFRQRIRSIFKT